ncbi:MAG: hypothetical protein ACR2H1_08180 [Limisphaerales bacterium]
MFFCFAICSSAKAGWSAGPLYDDFSLTLSSGHRTEIAGPLYFFEQNDSQRQWAVPPLFSYTHDPDVEAEEFDFLYPLLTYDRFGSEYRFEILQLFSFAGGQTQSEIQKKRFTLFPLYFQQRSTDPNLNYTALFPLYGTIKNRLFRDEIKFVLFPAYAKTRKKDVVTQNILFPVFHWRQGEALQGWQVWPLVGHEHKEPTHKTNSLDELVTIGGHDKWFGPWPIFFKDRTGIGTTNEQNQISVLPLFTRLRSPNRDSATYLWPIGLTLTDEREKKYHEVGFPWPFFVVARGEGKTVTRFWPLFSRAHNQFLQSDFYLWPIYKFNRLHSEPLDRSRLRILFYLYSDTTEKNTQTGDFKRRLDLWPLFTARHDLNGNERLQILAPLEPIFPHNKSIERDYSPLWSIWRSEKNAKTGASSQSLLWNLYRREKTPDTKKCAVFFGLFQYESDARKKTFRSFSWPLFKQEKE